MTDLSDSRPSIVDLAEAIQNHTETISDYLSQNSLPELSSLSDGYPFFPGTGPPHLDRYPKPPQKVLDARTQAREACESLMQLITGPADQYFYYITQHLNSVALQYLYRFRIAESVPLNERCTFQDAATKAGVDAGQCTRVLRMAMTSGYFQEPTVGYVAHTAGSMLLLDPNLRDAAGYVVEESLPASGKTVEAILKWPQVEETNETAWNLAHGSDLPMFQFFESHPARMERFMGAMRMMSEGEGYDIKHLVNGFDWKALGEGLVVDVGGSFGHCSYSIADTAPKLSFVVQDLEKVIRTAKTERINDRHGERVKFEAHDFFEPQPIRNADVYLLRFICHDYSDKYAAKILANIVSAMGPKSKILIVDGVLPPPGTLTKAEERKLRILDMNMLISFNGGERDVEGWMSLFKRADSRLGLRHMWTPPDSALSLMELDLAQGESVVSPT
ncbi:hypothetical protein LTR10_017562 [Elasticomyces elasticus]|uniref:O-methyltransferase C-terminal domain-containing protein n=1 Tax=Exophiala sideris TaxID=1016849 RepID=A0ABR0IZK3_9EURO|nr:hypothetical protein LTR10_017562 [Elasticomyces elasticus]KAK5023431.1 hypothetical protein LTS07_009306 [Exophiala sideris]KAK5028194.1 hypothetical protein LTR13_009182 [Exophiala sideris]KAK5052852.1 hypothetical protein LTR69_009678 [Exophiala sideris]KAK5178463.1 hypothetical protein LTR44_009088 [Eurotiomycetes sp. CCFEE 6388]